MDDEVADESLQPDERVLGWFPAYRGHPSYLNLWYTFAALAVTLSLGDVWGHVRDYQAWRFMGLQALLSAVVAVVAFMAMRLSGTYRVVVLRTDSALIEYRRRWTSERPRRFLRRHALNVLVVTRRNRGLTRLVGAPGKLVIYRRNEPRLRDLGVLFERESDACWARTHPLRTRGTPAQASVGDLRKIAHSSTFFEVTSKNRTGGPYRV